MKVVQRSQNLLILQERPLFLWIIAGVSIPLGFFIIASLIKNQDNQFWTILLGGVFIASGLFSIYVSPFATYRFDRTLGNFILKRKGLSGIKVIKYHLNEIKDVQVEESISSDGNTYRVTIVLVSGEQLPLTHYYTSGKSGKYKAVSCIKSFLNINN
ncbi:MAG: hypothetical protein WBA41_24825 [Rivularia sp. (in: cyanobacteria)]